MPNEHWSVTITRGSEKWGAEFTEHWTYKYEGGTVTYKLRVVGPNGEVCRDELDRENVRKNVRAEFEEKFREAKEIA